MPPSASTAPFVPSARVTPARIGLRAFFRLWFGRWRHRRALGRLHPDQMREVGLNPMDVRRESGRPVWRA